MVLGENVSFFKMIGTFGLIIMLVFILGGTIVGVIKALNTGEWKQVLESTGGRVFSIDSALNKEVIFLTDPKNVNVYENLFHLSYGLSLLFVIFSIGFLIFRFFNWATGVKQFSPTTDIMSILLIFLIFLLIQFAYTYYVLKETIIPLTGIIKFFASIPKIIGNMI